MRTEQIYYLDMINRYASINTAASELGISPQALSLSMKTLEDELGMPILMRTKSGSFLTTQGKELLSHGNTFLNAIENMKNNRPSKYSALQNGSIRLFATDGVIETVLSSAISQLYLDYPNFRVQTERMKFSEIINKLTSKEDCQEGIGIVYHLYSNKTPITEIDTAKFVFHPFITEQYFVVAHSRFPICNYKRVSLKTVISYPNIFYAPTVDVFKLMFKQFPDFLKNSIIVDNYALYKQMILNGAGLGLYAASNANFIEIPPQIKLIPFKEKIISSLGCLTRKRKLSLQEQELIDYLKNYYQHNQSDSVSKRQF